MNAASIVQKMSSSHFLDKSLLVLSHSYAAFTKDQIESLAPFFKQVTVLVRHAFLTELLSFLPFNSFKPYLKEVKVDRRNLPHNVTVLPIPLLYLPIDKGYKNLGDRHYRAVRRIINKSNIPFDFIHAHFTWSAGYVGARLKEAYQTPLVITAHGYDIYDLPFRDNVWRHKIKYVLESADAVITVSQSNGRCIEQLDVQASTLILPNGYKKELFYPEDQDKCRRYLNLPINKPIILTVGSLTPIKGQSYLIEAMKAVVQREPEALCIIVGSGQLKHKLERQIQDANLSNHIYLVGQVRHHQIRSWMNACDLFVLPSERESFGVVQIEAMACGKPVIATRNGGSEEIVISNQLGKLAPPKNPIALSEAILQALNTKWDSEQIIKYANKFDWHNIAQQILGVYAGIVSTQSPNSPNLTVR